MNIERLTEPFRMEDPLWSMPGVIRWLAESKKISPEIADAAIKSVLIEMDSGARKIETHRGANGFDNTVLDECKKLSEKIFEQSVSLIESTLNEKTKLYQKTIEGGYFSKLWKALTGQL